jgi:putative ABC transport system permease protein
MSAIARLKDGVSLEAANAEISALLRPLRGLPDGDTKEANSGLPRIEVLGVKEEQARPFRPALFVLTIAVGFVLLIACINVGTLQLARAASRQREIATRMSLGATQGRLVLQILTESIVLAILSGVAGLAVGFAGTKVLNAQWPGNVFIPGRVIPTLDGIGINAMVFAFSFFISIVTGLLFGLAPALWISRKDQMEVIKSSSTASGAGFKLVARAGPRSIFVVIEVGMATVLLVGAGLLIHSFLKLANVDPGFDATNVLTFQVQLPGATSAQKRSLSEQLLARLQRLPEVKSAGYSTWGPLEPGATSGPRFEITGVPNGTLPGIALRFLPVSRDYLQTIGVRLIAGRWFNENDDSGQPLAMLINTELARYFPDKNPIGRFVTSGTTPQPAQIVGVVESIRQRGLDSEPQPQYFLDWRQYAGGIGPFAVGGFFAVRTQNKPISVISAIRSVVSQLDTRATVDSVATMEQLVANSVAIPRFYALLTGVFAGVAVVLATIGIYGIVAYSVTQRIREIGIRMAIGARRQQVLSLVLRQGLLLAVIGIVIGIASAAVLTQYLTTFLFGLTPLDSMTFALVSLGFALIAVVASYIPARRATKIDPSVALRWD